MKCPLCGKPMSTMSENAPSYVDDGKMNEPIYFCEQHGPMNKLTDIKEKADEISKKV
ncbi:MAG TPA: hypothetical protein VEG61_03125 [Candidatus Dormibacteraeota bacterium]|nr:hypothetical protein [Candidatus Dormibacteraeota bacterium]